MTKKKNKTLSIKYISLNVLNYYQHDIGEYNVKKDEVIEYIIDNGVKLLEELEQIHLMTTVKLSIKEKDTIFCELKVLSKFEVKTFSDVILRKNESTYSVPDTLMSKLTTIALGTIRGVLHEKLRGTILQNELLPLIDLNNNTNEK